MSIRSIVFCVCVLIASTGFIFSPGSKPTVPPTTIAHHNVIIYPDDFQTVAEGYRDFHRTYEQAESLLVPLSEIKKKGRTSDLKPKEDGWENMRPTLNEIKNYDYQLALEITDYLRDLSEKQKIDSVLLLGDGGLVPPSYYFYIDYEHDLPAPDYIKEYTAWIASDHYYSAPDYTMNYQWTTGRVAVDTIDEAKEYLTNLIEFKLVHQQKPNLHTIYAGSNVGHNRVYMGEMFYLAMQDLKLFGDDVSFYFESDGKFLKEHQLKAFGEEDALFHWLFSHGMGQGFVMADNTQITVKELMDLPRKKYLPLVLSPSCLDAGFDYDLIPLPFAREEKKSVGEAVIASRGCGIGYMGSTRLALAGLDFRTEPDTGRVRIKSVRYMPKLLLNYLDTYHKGTLRIADAFKIAHDTYIAEETDHKDPGFRAMYANFAFLGDPVLSLPEPPKFSDPRHRSVTFLNAGEPDELDTDFTVPGFTPSSHRLAKEPIVHFMLENPDYNLQHSIYSIINVTTHTKIVDEKPLKPSNYMQFKPEPGNLYLIKSRTPTNRMSWQYFYVRDPS